MVDHPIAQATQIAAGDDKAAEGGRYDGTAMVLHWLTALLVVTLFALAHIWDFLPRGGGLRHGLQSLHISLGIAMAVVVVLRLAWRNAFSRRLQPADTGLVGVAARGAHYLLYLLLITMIVSGFGRQWSGGHPLGFFGLFSLPDPFAIAKSWHPLISKVHSLGAWAIIALSGLHAAAALFHHYVLRDGVMRRMMPGSTAG